VGESGCGKTVSALAVLGLIPSPPGEVVSGRILFQGRDLLELEEEDLRKIRGNSIAMVFQEPLTSLNPVFTVGDQIAEAIRIHRPASEAELRGRSVNLLADVGIPSPADRLGDYPHQLSGGQRQRVMIAMALACDPELIIADEPTTALDVTVQAQILELMLQLQADFNTAIMMITHDLGVIAEIARRVVVMYAGRIVEEAETGPLFEDPKHPYTQGLLRSIPKLGSRSAGERVRLEEIKGMVPGLLNLPKGCRFSPRCPHAMGICREKDPPLKRIGRGRTARCWLYFDEPGKD
jgi:oligopeptide/dipeptide ABC transporter ATP-binding protein